MLRNKIIGLYLAAGQSTRMGADKLRLPLGPTKLGNRALAAALSSGLDYVWVIVNDAGADWLDSAFYAEPLKRKWSVIRCPEAHLGQAHSVRCGVRAALAAEASAAMILLADQPFVTSGMINELLLSYQTHRLQRDIGFAAARNGSLARPPVLFARRLFPELLQLQGDQGARHLIREDPSGICVDFAPDLFIDVDTAEDYGALLGKAFPKS